MWRVYGRGVTMSLKVKGCEGFIGGGDDNVIEVRG